MAFILKRIQAINGFFDKYGDPRLADFPLMSSPFYTIAISLTYIYTVKVLLPRYMENRKPFQIKKVLLMYNFIQVLISCYLFYELGMGGWFTGDYSFRCQPVDYSYSPTGLRMLHAAKSYYLAKFTEFLDTIFFLLRKKNKQVTNLHIIHHSIMPVSVWFGLKLVPGGHGSFFGLLNSFIHIIMYGYYFLSACGPTIQKYLWWKKFLTALQMLQFAAIICHSFQLLFIDCNFPQVFVWVIGLHGILFFSLFQNFYSHAYIKKEN